MGVECVHLPALTSVLSAIGVIRPKRATAAPRWPARLRIASSEHCPSQRRTVMIVVRTVMQAKFGRGGELAANFAEANRKMMGDMNQAMGGQRRWRLLTDLTGDFDTVILEVEAESMAEWERARGVLFQLPAFRESMASTQDLVVTGRNELWNVEAEG